MESLAYKSTGGAHIKDELSVMLQYDFYVLAVSADDGQHAANVTVIFA